MNVSFAGGQIFLRSCDYKLKRANGEMIHDGFIGKPVHSQKEITIDSSHIAYTVNDNSEDGMARTKLYMSNGDVIEIKKQGSNDKLIDIAKSLNSKEKINIHGIRLN